MTKMKIPFILLSCCLLQALVAIDALGPPRNIRVVFIRYDPPFGTVTWDPPADAPGPIDYYWMRFGEEGQTHLQERQITGRTPFTAIMGENGVIYKISVAADIDGERGEYALEVVKAPELRPIATPEYLNVTGLSPTSVHAAWDPPMKSGRRGKIVNYMLEWRKDSGEAQRLWTSNLNTSDTSATVGDSTPLEPDTDYVFRVRAFNSAGYGPISPTFQFKTDKAVFLLGPPRNIRVTFIYHDPPFGTVSWDPPANAPDPIDYYWMKFGEKGQTQLEERQIAGRTPFTAIYAENGLEYNIRVAGDIDGERGEYALLTVKAPDGRPSAPPQNLSVTGLSPTTVRVTWEPPAKASRKGKIVKYMVEWVKETESQWLNNMNTSVNAVTIGNAFPLDADTDYLFRVRAFTSADKAGPETEQLQFRTDKGVSIGPYGDVPPVLLNCTLTRTDDGRMMAPDWEAHPEIKTEEECAAKCLEVPMCDSATFTNTTKTCEIHPRRIYFRVGWMGKEGTSVMFEKDCPSFVKYPGRDRNKRQLICPLDRGVPKPSKKYAYKLKRYRATYEDGSYECRIDELCAGLSYEIDPANGKLHFTYYYDATPDEGTPISNRSAVKNCQPTGPNCGFFDAYYKKSIRANWPFLYSTVSLRREIGRRGKLGDCLDICEKASRCHAAAFVDYFRQLDCNLYGRPSQSAGPSGYRNRLERYTGHAEKTTWIKSPALCTQGTGK
ncbi:tyrosine-protein phosphatase Lar-like [Lineus longissimus]|uniref:tyrosine-protein phosphatase Lar-like n=1 Tax=Lineus longissimus TaxID=88925 RepID=UPI002B4E87DE